MFGLGPMEMVIVGVVAVLLFGSRLPSVARSLGKSMTEFKRGMNDLHNDIDPSTPPQVRNYGHADDRDEPTAPKFEPPTSEPETEKPSEA
jgi:sec-independent protein translocase protein TatA